MNVKKEYPYTAPGIEKLKPEGEPYPYYNGARISIPANSGVSVGDKAYIKAVPRRFGVDPEDLGEIDVVADFRDNFKDIPGKTLQRMKEGQNNDDSGANQWDISYRVGSNESGSSPLLMGNPQENLKPAAL